MNNYSPVSTVHYLATTRENRVVTPSKVAPPKVVPTMRDWPRPPRNEYSGYICGEYVRDVDQNKKGAIMNYWRIMLADNSVQCGYYESEIDVWEEYGDDVVSVECVGYAVGGILV